MLGSVQDKLLRVRPPRVKITYDVETGGSPEKLELPFIAGIFSDLTGFIEDPTNSHLPAVKDRKFVEVDPDTFPKLMLSSKPAVDLSEMYNVLEKPAEEYPSLDKVPKLKVAEGVKGLVFTKMEDFEPEHLIKRIEPLNERYEKRQSLRTLQSKGEMVDAVSEILQKSVEVSNTDVRKELLDFAKANPGGLSPQAALEAEKARREEAGETALTEDEEKTFLAARQPAEVVVTPAVEADENADPPVEAQDEVKGPGFVGQLIKPSMLVQKSDIELTDEEQQKREQAALSLIIDFANEVLTKFDAGVKDKSITEDLSLAASIDNAVAKIDQALSRQLDVILHTEEFQKLEATWRGLSFLLNNTETSKTLKLKVFNVSKDDLRNELAKAVEFDQSVIFKLVYEEEYGTYGGKPYSMLMGDYEFDRTPADQELLKLISSIAAAAHAPFVAAAYAKLFDMETFANLAKPRDLSKIFESVELATWQGFRESEDSRYVTLALPRVLFRLPWGGDKGMPVEAIDYQENVMDMPVGKDGKPPKQGAVDGSKMLWGNAAWVLTQRVTNAHAIYGWTAAIRGVEGGGLVENLPTYTYTSSDGDIELLCPTQVSITDRREKELNDLGFMAICHCKGSAKAAFFGGQSTKLPKKYLSDLATSNSRLSSQLPYMLCASRFAHYIKVMMRDKIGSFLTKENVEDFLNSWITQYVLLDDNATQASKAAYPLRQANVVATENLDKPGSYNATVFIRPHFQLEELTASIRLVAEIPG